MKILLIDDSTLSRNMLKRALAGDHQFVEAENGMRGIEFFYLEKPDLVFLDLTMPGADGFEILEKLRKIDPQARIIIATADIQEMTRKQAVDAGASAYLTKPFSTEAVQEVVRQVIEPGQG